MRLLHYLLIAFVSGLSGANALADMPTSRRSDAAYARNAPQMQADMEAAGLAFGAPVYLRITKIPARLTAYVERPDGSYTEFRTWKICTYSGGLGPKYRQGDGKSPEGAYSVSASAMNPASSYHLSFNLGYPNARDRALGLTGDYLMVHGDCVSIGCYAMTDAGIEEIWTLMQAAFENGQRDVPVHIFPFEMTAANLMAHSGHSEIRFWRELSAIWMAFETSARPPTIIQKNGHYLVAGEE